MSTRPQHFGRYHLTVEDAVYGWLRELSEDYSGGYWHFYELSNGGFYMTPELEALRIHVDGNGLEGTMMLPSIREQKSVQLGTTVLGSNARIGSEAISARRSPSGRVRSTRTASAKSGP